MLGLTPRALAQVRSPPQTGHRPLQSGLWSGEKAVRPRSCPDHLVGFDQALGVERVVVGVLVGRGHEHLVQVHREGLFEILQAPGTRQRHRAAEGARDQDAFDQALQQEVTFDRILLAHTGQLGAELVHGAFDVGLSGAARLATRSRASIAAKVTTPPRRTIGSRAVGEPRDRQLLLGGRRRRPELVATHLDLIEGLGERLGRRLGILQDLAQPDLELRQLAVDVLLGLALHGAGGRLGFGEDPLAFAIGTGHDGFLACHLQLLLAGGRHQGFAVGLGLRQQFLAVLHDPASLLDLVGQRFLHLGDQVEDLIAVDEHRGRERHGLGLAHEFIQLVEPGGDVHGQRASSRSSSRFFTWSGTRPSTLPPNRATSFTSEEDRNDHFGFVGMNRVSTSPRRWFIWAIWISNS